MTVWPWSRFARQQARIRKLSQTIAMQAHRVSDEIETSANAKRELAVALTDNRHMASRIERLELDLSQAQADLRRAVEVNGQLAVRKSDPLAALLAADPHAEVPDAVSEFVDTPGATAADIAEKIATALTLRGEATDRKD